jgi:hypothetical protein
MSSFGPSTRRVSVFAAAGLALLAIAAPSTAADPATDALGFVDSSARCTAPDTAVVFGSTATSQVAICKAPSGQYEYHGVRISDGAKLVVPASLAGDGSYAAKADGITYTVMSSALVVSQGDQVLRRESMVYFQRPTTPQAPAKPLPPPLPAEVGGGGP